MPKNWLSGPEVAAFLRNCNADNAELILELRNFVHKVAPDVTEAIKFHSLCYFVRGRPYGAIGGNVCGIGEHKGTVYLSFIHGAALPDPEGLLVGDGKAMRKIPIYSSADFRRPAVRELILASMRYDPTEQDV
jgi:hypothetical protein